MLLPTLTVISVGVFALLIATSAVLTPAPFDIFALPISELWIIILVPSVTYNASTMGFVGPTVSIVIASTEEVELFPAESVSVTVMLQVPFDKVPRVQAPDETVHVTLVDPDFAAVTIAVPVPVNVPEAFIVGVGSLVMSSLLDLPKSESDARSGVAGIEGATLSLVIVLVAVAALAGPSNALPETELAFILG